CHDARCLPDPASHSLIVPVASPAASVRPSGLKHAAKTPPAWPFNFLLTLPECAFTRDNPPSLRPKASAGPSGAHASAVTGRPASSEPRSFFGAVPQRRTVPSQHAAASALPSGENASKRMPSFGPVSESLARP